MFWNKKFDDIEKRICSLEKINEFSIKTNENYRNILIAQEKVLIERILKIDEIDSEIKIKLISNILEIFSVIYK
ncbi:MAG: hypothetical protein WCG23_12080 [bacterium]